MREASMPQASDPATYANADIRLAAVDMDGTLLDDQKNFPAGLEQLLDSMEDRGITFVPASGRQIWTLINMFPGRAGMTFIGENGAVVMRDGEEISSSPLDLGTVRRCVELVRHHVRQGDFFAEHPDSQDGNAQEMEAAQWDGGLVVAGRNQRISSAAMNLSCMQSLRTTHELRLLKTCLRYLTRLNTVNWMTRSSSLPCAAQEM